MQKYKVIAEEGVQLEENAVVQPKGTVVELDPADSKTQPLLDSGSIEAVTDTDTQSVGEEVGPFRVRVGWVPGATQADIEGAQAFATEIITELNSKESEIPPVVQSITIVRI